MIRKLSLALAVAAALSPLNIFALGLGEIHTHSALNQYFKADIDLLSITQEELQDVKVGLASSEAFEKAGIDRPFLLTGLKFTPAMTADGRPVIAVSSRDPVREPFLNFLIEVNWPKGRLVREYTVLLDPPVTLERQPAPIQTPRVSVMSARDSEPVEGISSVEAAATSPSTNPIAAAGERVYGPIQENDNLWRIAESIKREGETVEQVMMALLRYNPDAFIRNNVNLLKAGKILRLPETADVTAMAPREARREFLAQTREWREAKQQSDASGAEASQTLAGEPATSGEPEAVDRLELISSESSDNQEFLDLEGDAEAGEEIARLEKQIMFEKEENASIRLENKTLNARIAELEAQLEDMQRLLTLQSDQMTELQTSQRIVSAQDEAMPEVETPALETAPAPTETMETPAIEQPESGDTTIAQVNIEQVIAEAIQADTTATPPVEAAAITAPASLQTPSPKAEAPAAVSEPVAATEPAVRPESAAKPPATAESEPASPSDVAKAPQSVGFLQSFMGNPTLMGLSGSVLVLLLILSWLVLRRRKAAGAEFAESILVTQDGEAVASTGRSGAAAINEPSEETSFMSDFSPSDIDALQDETGEVDPVSEADVYIAYGRYQQAEELINQAIERFPERDELKYKLLEIHYSAKNEAKFSSLAEALRQGGLEKEKPEVWAKIATMGRELNPSNMLFAAGACLAAGVASSEDEELDDLGLNLDSQLSDDMLNARSERSAESAPKAVNDVDTMDPSGFEGLDEADSDHLEASLSLDSDFLDSLESVSNKQPQSAAELAADHLDIDLGELESAEASEGQAAEDDLALASSLDGLSDLSELEMDRVSRHPGEDEVNEEVGLESADSLQDLDLESLEKELELLSGDLGESQEEPVAAQGSTAAPNLLDLPDELEAPIDELPREEVALDDTDEVTTKLDLARAYVDMGDAEGAKSILEEVVTEGSDDQKQQAKELLGAINA